MAYKLSISEKADLDVDSIVHYIAVELANPQAASSLLDRLEACYDRLEENPMLYALTPHPLFHALGIRKAPIGGYGVFYQIENEVVHIVRVLSDLESLEGKL